MSFRVSSWLLVCIECGDGWVYGGGDAGYGCSGVTLIAVEVFDEDGDCVVAMVGQYDVGDIVMGRECTVGIVKSGAGLVGYGDAVDVG